MRSIFLFILLLLICNVSFSQTKYFYGKLIDSITLLPIENVQVVNLHTQETDATNSKGLFVLKGSLNDTLYFFRVGYWEQHVVLKGNIAARDTMQIMLVPKTAELKSVTVSTYSYSDYQQDSTDRRKTFEQEVGYAHHVFESSNSGAGIGLSLDRLFGRKQKNKHGAYKYFLNYEQEEYIKFRFNPILVHSLTGYIKDTLQDFMIKYQPSYEWLRKHTSNEDIYFYVNDKLKEYKYEK